MFNKLLLEYNMMGGKILMEEAYKHVDLENHPRWW